METRLKPWPGIRPKTQRRNVSVSDGYLEFVRRFPLRPILNEEAIDEAIAVIDALLDRDGLSPAERDYLEALSDLVERYEDQAHAIGDVSEGAMLRFLIDQKDLTQAEVARHRHRRITNLRRLSGNVAKRGRGSKGWRRIFM